MYERLRSGLYVPATAATLFMALVVFSPGVGGTLTASCESQSCRDEVATNLWNPVWTIRQLVLCPTS